MTTVYRLRSSGLQWREIGGETVVLDVSSSLYLSANSSGSILWSELVGGATAGDLADRLVEEFGIDAERAVADTRTFLDALRERSLLHEEAA